MFALADESRAAGRTLQSRAMMVAEWPLQRPLCLNGSSPPRSMAQMSITRSCEPAARCFESGLNLRSSITVSMFLTSKSFFTSSFSASAS